MRFGRSNYRVNTISKKIWINELFGNFLYKSHFKRLVDNPTILDFDHYGTIWKCLIPS